MCLAASQSGGLKSHQTVDQAGTVSKGGGALPPALIYQGGQGVRRKAESEGLEENLRVVIDGSHSNDELVGER